MDLDPSTFRAAASAGAHVTQMAFLVIGGTWAGSWVDVWLDSAPVFLLLGSGAGMALGLYLLVRSFEETNEPESHDDPDDAA